MSNVVEEHFFRIHLRELENTFLSIKAKSIKTTRRSIFTTKNICDDTKNSTKKNIFILETNSHIFEHVLVNMSTVYESDVVHNKHTFSATTSGMIQLRFRLWYVDVRLKETFHRYVTTNMLGHSTRIPFQGCHPGLTQRIFWQRIFIGYANPTTNINADRES